MRFVRQSIIVALKPLHTRSFARNHLDYNIGSATKGNQVVW